MKPTPHTQAQSGSSRRVEQGQLNLYDGEETVGWSRERGVNAVARRLDDVAPVSVHGVAQ